MIHVGLVKPIVSSPFLKPIESCLPPFQTSTVAALKRGCFKHFVTRGMHWLFTASHAWLPRRHLIDNNWTWLNHHFFVWTINEPQFTRSPTLFKTWGDVLTPRSVGDWVSHSGYLFLAPPRQLSEGLKRWTTEVCCSCDRSSMPLAN